MSEHVKTLSVGISPCPNDSFIFGGLVLGLVPEIPGHALRFAWEDVQTLNESARSRTLDIVKLSAAAVLGLRQDYAILSSGGAFGLDHNGPKLVTRPHRTGKLRRIAVPGLQTTAFALLRKALGNDFEPVPMLYDRIKDAVLEESVDAGLLIHETALVYGRHNLALRLDLGEWWAGHTGGLPLPLGVIAVRRDMHPETARLVEERIRSSLEAAMRDRAPIWPLVRRLAQEMDDETLGRHISAYVNEYSLDMGPAGRAALDRLAEAL